MHILDYANIYKLIFFVVCMSSNKYVNSNKKFSKGLGRKIAVTAAGTLIVLGGINIVGNYKDSGNLSLAPRSANAEVIRVGVSAEDIESDLSVFGTYGSSNILNNDPPSPNSARFDSYINGEDENGNPLTFEQYLLPITNLHPEFDGGVNWYNAPSDGTGILTFEQLINSSLFSDNSQLSVYQNGNEIYNGNLAGAFNEGISFDVFQGDSFEDVIWYVRTNNHGNENTDPKNPVPEPGTMGLFLVGLGGGKVMIRRFKKKKSLASKL